MDQKGYEQRQLTDTERNYLKLKQLGGPVAGTWVEITDPQPNYLKFRDVDPLIRTKAKGNRDI